MVRMSSLASLLLGLLWEEGRRHFLAEQRCRFVRHRWGAPPAVSGLGINRRQNFAGGRRHHAGAGRRRRAMPVNRRLATPVDNRQGLDPGPVTVLSAPPPLNFEMGVLEPAVAAPAAPLWCRVHRYGPCPARSSGTRLPSPTPAEEEEREIVHDVPARGYSPAPTRVASARGDGLVFIPTPGRAMATAGAVTTIGASGSAGPGLGVDAEGTSSAPWAFGRSPAPPGEQRIFLLGTGGPPAPAVAGTSRTRRTSITWITLMRPVSFSRRLRMRLCSVCTSSIDPQSSPLLIHDASCNGGPDRTVDVAAHLVPQRIVI